MENEESKELNHLIDRFKDCINANRSKIITALDMGILMGNLEILSSKVRELEAEAQKNLMLYDQANQQKQNLEAENERLKELVVHNQDKRNEIYEEKNVFSARCFELESMLSKSKAINKELVTALEETMLFLPNGSFQRKEVQVVLSKARNQKVNSDE